jgi:hypothetical protein
MMDVHTLRMLPRPLVGAIDWVVIASPAKSGAAIQRDCLAVPLSWDDSQ